MPLSHYRSWDDVLRDHPCLGEAVCMWDRDCAAVSPEDIYVNTNKIPIVDDDKVVLHEVGAAAYLWVAGERPMDWCRACGCWREMRTTRARWTSEPDPCHPFRDRVVPRSTCEKP